jgi:large conductance mechanosensitive channel
MLKEFRQFILRGNLVDLAVAVVIGAAFTAVVNAMVRDIVTPIIAAIGGKPNFSNLAFTINGSRFLYGDFINALLTFLIVALVIFFMVVKPVNALMARYKPETSLDQETHACPECLSDVPVGATRCAFCTTQLAAA